MSTRIHVAGIVDVLRIDDPVEMHELNEHPAVGRAPVAGGGLFNRMLRRRIGELRSERAPLPVFVDRENRSSRERQLSLTDALEKRHAGSDLQTTALRRIARYVAGAGSASEAAIAIQQAAGRIFVPTFLATEETLSAAVVFDSWPRIGPLRRLWLRFTGRFRRARTLLSNRAHGDAHCLHAIGIAVHNAVKAVENMRALAISGTPLPDGEADAIVDRCLVAPQNAIRWCRSALVFKGRRLNQGTLIQFQLERMRGTAGDRATFHAGEWSACPANDFIQRLLAEIWRESRRVASGRA